MRYLLSLIAVCVIFFGCKKSDNSKPQLDTEKTITSFSFSSGNNTQLTSDVVATIDQTNKKITAVLPAGVSLNNLKASFTISAKATVTISGVTQISGVTSNNYANSLSYTVKAEDNTTQDYTVILSSTVIILQNSITNFSFTTANNPMLTANINATIDQANSKISIVFPEGLDLTNLKATYTTAANATVRVNGVIQTSNVTPNNFSLVKKYDVITSNNVVLSYTIDASVNTSGPNIYVAGEAENGVRVWKNGIATNLYNSINSLRVNDMFVSGNDIFVVGYEESGNGYKIAKLWRNGSSVNLSELGKDAEATAVYVNGADVYVVGTEKLSLNSPFNIAKLWKNGVAVNLTSSTSSGYAHDICVANGDVYVVGVDFHSSPYYSWIWKNGVLSNLTNFNRVPVSITVLNNDVYILGGDNGPDPLLWKNGTITTLGVSGYNYQCFDIEVSGSDVYFSALKQQVGNTSKYAYYKNGIENIVTNNITVGTGFDVKVKGNDVYYAGSAIISIPPTSPNWKAQLWKNGQSISLHHSGQFVNYGKCIFLQ